jgi:hypothetical protein
MSNSVNTHKTSTEPFLFALVKPANKEQIAEDIRISHLARDSYDPRSQVSKVMAGKGTSRTYSSTGTGNVIMSDTDDRPSDT